MTYSLVARDPAAGELGVRDFRQVAVVDSTGATAVHTGDACLPAAASVGGEDFSAQGNAAADERWRVALSAVADAAFRTRA